MDRRTFLKTAGMGSLAFTTACTLEGEKKLYSLVRTPDDMVTGKARWYASTCRECPAGCGVLAKNREGRVIKLEGNPLHPINRGSLCMRGQAALQGVYNPDRLTRPLLKEGGRRRPISHQEAAARLRERIGSAASRGENRVRMMSRIEGESLTALFNECMAAWRSGPPLIYEPLSYNNLKKANASVFGVDGLFRYRIEEADFLLGFGADFLETWLSPVEYARRYKAMHAFSRGKKGLFYHVGPFRGLTGANADAWIASPPGGEAILCLGLVREMLARGRGSGLSPAVLQAAKETSAPYTAKRVSGATGVSEAKLEELSRALSAARAPVVLGTSALSHSENDLAANIAANLLNAVLDPRLSRIDFEDRHRVETAAGHAAAAGFFAEIGSDEPEVLIFHQVNPVHAMPGGEAAASLLARENIFSVCFTGFLDETAEAADLVIPISLPLEEWGEYTSAPAVLSTLQPAMPALAGAPSAGDAFLSLLGRTGERHASMKHYMMARLTEAGVLGSRTAWLQAVRSGGVFSWRGDAEERGAVSVHPGFAASLREPVPVPPDSRQLLCLPSIRFFDGRGANLPWLCEIPDPVTKVAWQTPLLLHPDTAAEAGISRGGRVKVEAGGKTLSCPAYPTENLVPGVYAMQVGQGHTAYGRYAENRGANPVALVEPRFDTDSGAALLAASPAAVKKAGGSKRLAHTDGSMDQLGRKIALTATPAELEKPAHPEKEGLAMHEFPLTLPLPEGYDPARDFYPPHDHEDYRWAMTVDLDRCIGCNACAAACYAENNLGVVGEEEVINGREMSWMRIERYRQTDAPEHLIFLPMLCQHCDNAPCESVCPVYAPHHSKQGLNNQIYNRCIGTRFCAQNCPYKVRRFNWHEWQWPEPLNLQLNPDVTARTKGVMEKCSFCIQRIKAAHNRAKNEGRKIRDGEVTPACVQTCPTGALVFGSLMDKKSRVSKKVRYHRAYQVMGYLNTKPAVIYLKKVVRG
jgi:molybdopterin-containing oxidoreductase family iron-sulfur binding subunit